MLQQLLKVGVAEPHLLTYTYNDLGSSEYCYDNQ